MQNGTYVRMTKLNNVVGRSEYIKDEKRQENIVLISDQHPSWKDYAEYENAHQKSAQKNIQARELIIAFPKDFTKGKSKNELKKHCDEIAKLLVEKDTDWEYAVHNTSKNNLHMHLIFSERTIDPNQKIKHWDRTIYATPDGKVARKKADRAIDKDGNYIVLHKKGDLKNAKFTAKNKLYKQKNFTASRKQIIKKYWQKNGVKFEKSKPMLHQYHEGKGQQAVNIRQTNQIIRIENEIAKNIDKSVVPDYKKACLKSLPDKKVCLYYQERASSKFTFVTMDTWKKICNLFRRWLKSVDPSRETIVQYQEIDDLIRKKKSERKLLKSKMWVLNKEGKLKKLDDEIDMLQKKKSKQWGLAYGKAELKKAIDQTLAESSRSSTHDKLKSYQKDIDQQNRERGRSRTKDWTR